MCWAGGLSNTLETAFCVDAWEAALRAGRQALLISNTDQGSQFTSPMFIDAVESAGVDVSMDGRGRWIDNRFIERLWRSAKYEDIFICRIDGDGLAAGRGLGRWLDNYNQERPLLKRWVMRRQQKCTWIPALTVCPAGDFGSHAHPKDMVATKRLEIRPPAAVCIGTPVKTERE